MTGPEAPETGSASTMLAIALWLISLVPQWGLMLWGIGSLDRLRQAVARHFAFKLLAVVTWCGTILLAVNGTVVACRDYLGPERLGLQRIIANATLAQEVLLIVVGIVLLARRPRPPGVPVRKPPSPRDTRVHLLGWTVTSVVLVALALGPFSGHSGEPQIWGSLAVAITAIIWLMVKVIRQKRTRRVSQQDG